MDLHRIAFDRLRLALAMLALIAVPAQAEHAAATPPHFQNLGLYDGLAQNTVRAITQGERGLLWFGTEDGLHRYDGYGFELHRKSRDPARGLRSGMINALLSDSRGDLWIGTQGGGIHLMAGANEPIVPVVAKHPDDHRAVLNVWSIIEDRDGRTWFTSNAGPGWVDRTVPAYHVLAFPAALDTIPPASAWHVVQDRGGGYWLAGENLLLRFDTPDGEWRRFDLPGMLDIRAGEGWRVTTLLADPRGGILLTLPGRLVKLDANGGLAFDIALPDLSDDPVSVRDMLVEGETLWLATAGHGLLHFDFATRRFNSYRHDPALPNGLSDDRLVELFRDRAGLLWIGTALNGVDRFDPATLPMRHFRHHPLDADSLGNDNVWMFARRGDGPLWVDTDDGLSRVDPGTGKARRYFHDDDDPNSISANSAGSLRIDEHGHLWAGLGYSLDRYRPETDDFVRHPLSGGEDDWVVNFLPLGDERFIVGTYAGLKVLDTRSGRETPLSIDSETHPQLAHATTIAFARDAGGRVWLGTDFGLLAWTPGSSRVEDVMRAEWAALFGTGIQDIAVLRDGRIAIATENGLGLLPGAPGPFAWYDSEDGLPAGTLYGVREDRDGNVWISSNYGLARLDPASGDIDRFHSSDGLQSEEFNGGAAYRDAGGALYFGGINGFNVFHPRDLVVRNTPPDAVITGMFAGNRNVLARITRGAAIELDWNEDLVAIEYAATDFRAPRSNRFEVRLLPLQEDWTGMHGDRRSIYTNLPGGDYIFEVRAASKNGTWNEEPARLAFRVEEKPWLTWWAFAGYAAIGLFAGWLYLRRYGEQAAAQEKAAQELQQRRWVESLYELTASLAHTLDETEIAAGVVQHVAGTVGMDFAVLGAERGEHLEILGLHPPADPDSLQVQDFVAANSGFLQAAGSGMRARRMRVEEGPAGRACHLLVVPMRTRAGASMFLLLGRSCRDFNDKDTKYVTAYANQAVVAFDKAALFAEVQELATRDPLTGLANRRHFNERVEIEFERSRRFGHTFSLLMIDIDRFKQFNDRYGHDAGDDVLRAAGATLEKQLRAVDLAARYGGEEFIVGLPETGLAQAGVVAERLRAAMENLAVMHDGHALRVTASIGICSTEAGVRNMRELVRAADRALYQAKHAGRNRVVVEPRAAPPA